MKSDSHGRLTGDARRATIACPAQNRKTAVVLALGQSNAANYVNQKYASMYGDRVVNFFGGRCFAARSPLLGASGAGGEQWTALGNALIARGLYDRVVIAPAAIGGSSVQQWGHGELIGVLDATLDSLKGVYTPTIILWHQGETDLAVRTTPDEYRTELRSVVEHIRRGGLSAPFYVTVATRCVDRPTRWIPDNPIAHAQRAIADRALDIRVGVDADSDLVGPDRYDGCHLSRTGVEKLAQAWTDLLDADKRAVSLMGDDPRVEARSR